MGEGGVEPEYFLYKMRWWEVNRYLNGLQSRQHPYWEMTRVIQWYLSCIYWDPKSPSPKPKHPQDLFKFPWEKEQAEAQAMTEQDAKDIQEELDYWNNPDNFKWN